MKLSMDKKIPVLCSDAECTGCSACANSCNFNAISIIQNEEGFYRPSIDASKCTGCHNCEHRCPILHPLESAESISKVYAAWHKDENIRIHSTSGGAFSALAETIISEGGIVAGAAYTDNLMVRHICISSPEELHKLRLSKYVQSEIGFIFKEIKSYLTKGQKVLFSGTPCQVAGLKAFLVKDYDNLYCCDFICHGVPSALMLEKYLQWLQQHIGRINHINFRDKRKGWYDSLRVVIKDDGRQKILRGNKDAYWVGFNNHDNNLQLSCYNCHYLGLNRNSDITIADFWGIGKDKPFGHKDDIEKGVSMVMANNRKGQNLINLSKLRMETVERNVEEAVKSNQSILHSSPKPASRDSFYKDINSMTFDEMIKRHLTPNFKTKLVKIMREYVPFRIIKQIRMKNQH